MTILALRPGALVSDEEAVRRADLLKALADPTRLHLVLLLARHAGTLTVTDLVARFTLEQPTISHHLRILKSAGIISAKKRGLEVYYSVNRTRLLEAQQIIGGLL